MIAQVAVEPARPRRGAAEGNERSEIGARRVSPGEAWVGDAANFRALKGRHQPNWNSPPPRNTRSPDAIGAALARIIHDRFKWTADCESTLPLAHPEHQHGLITPCYLLLTTYDLPSQKPSE